MVESIKEVEMDIRVSISDVSARKLYQASLNKCREQITSVRNEFDAAMRHSDRVKLGTNRSDCTGKVATTNAK